MQSVRSEFLAKVMMGISLVVGTGLFGLTGLALDIGGPSSLLVGWAVAAVAVFPFLQVFMQLQTYCAAREGFTPAAGQALGMGLVYGMNILLLATYIVIIPLVAHIGSLYLQQTLRLDPKLLPFFTVAILTISVTLNFFGAHWIRRVNRLSWAIVVLILLSTIVFHWRSTIAGFDLLSGMLHGKGLPSFVAVKETAALVLFSFLGWENLVFLPSSFSRGVKRPSQIFLFSYVFVTMLYFALALVSAGASVTGAIPQSEAGLIGLMRQLPFWPVFVVGGVCIVVSNLTSWMHSANHIFVQVLQGGQILSGLAGSKNARDTLFPLYAMFVCVFSLLTSELVTTATLVQIVNKNSISIYLLLIGFFWKIASWRQRIAIGIPAILSSIFLVDVVTYALFVPVLLLSLGYLRAAILFGESALPQSGRKVLTM